MADGTLYARDLFDPTGGELERLKSTLDGIEKQINANTAAARVLKKTFDDLSKQKNSGDTKTKIKEIADETTRLVNAQNRLKESQQAVNLSIEKTKIQTAALTQETKNTAKATTAAAGSYNQLSAQLGLALAKLKAMSKAERETSAAGRDLTKDVTRLRAELKALDAQTGLHVRNVGNYKSALGGVLGSVKQLAAAYISLTGAQQLIGTIFTQTKALDGLDKAYLQVLGTEDKVAESQAFLSDLSERLGISLLDASKSYLRFRVAAEAGNLSVGQTNKIFEQVAKSASFLGLTVQDQEGVFRALEQIISKGTLSAEELRGQLGDRLPGAFIIAAKSLGVTTQELNKMLKAGEVVSSDFLPKFADQLEKTFNLETVDRVDNLAAAQARFGREVTLTIKELNAGGAFKSFFDILGKTFGVIRTNIDTIVSLLKVVGLLTVAWITGRIAQIAYTAALRLFGAQAVAATIQMRGLTVGTKLFGSAMVALESVIKKNPIGLLLTAALLLVPALLNASAATKELKETVDGLTSSYYDETKAVSENLKKIIAHDSTMRERQKAYDALKEQYPSILKNYDLEQIRLGGIISLQRELTAAIVDRIATEKKAEAEKKLFEKTQEANRFTPSTFSTENIVFGEGRTAGVDEKDIADARSKRAKKALDEYNAEIKAIDETAKALGNLNAIKVDSGGPKGRSFGASSFLTPDGDGVDELEKEIEDAVGGLGKLDKALLDSFQKRRENNAIELNERTKELEDLQIFFDEKKILFEKNQIDTTRLLEYYSIKRKEIEDRFNRTASETVTAPIETISTIGRVFRSPEEVAKEAKELKENIAKEISQIKADLSEPEDTQVDIFSLLGFDFSDETKQRITDSFQFAKDQLFAFFDAKNQLYEQDAERANAALSDAQKFYDQQVELAAAGYANELDQSAKRLAAAKKEAAETTKANQQAAKAQLAVNTALEAGNLVVAITNILKGPIPFPLNLLAVTTMLGAFGLAKIKAFQLAGKTKFGEGGVIDVGGGSHASGHDTALGVNVAGKPAYVEAREKVAIIKASSVQKYGSQKVNDLIYALNRGTLDMDLIRQERILQAVPFVSRMDFDSSRMEGSLDKLVEQGGRREATDQFGRRVIYNGRRKTIVN